MSSIIDIAIALSNIIMTQKAIIAISQFPLSYPSATLTTQRVPSTVLLWGMDRPAKVRQLRLPVTPVKHVLGFDVTVYDAACMEVLYSLCHAANVEGGLCRARKRNVSVKAR